MSLAEVWTRRFWPALSRTFTVPSGRVSTTVAPGPREAGALLRLPLDDGELLDGEALHALAGSAGLLGSLDRWSLQRALMTIDERSRRGEQVRLFLNLSIGALSDRSLAGWLVQMLKARRIDSDRLVLEFRLADVLNDLQNALQGLQSLQQAGVGLALEDFERDLTALQMLGYLPVGYLKLHERFSAPLLDEDSAAELRTLIEAAQGVGKKVMAARVENAPTAASLWTLGVDFIQGKVSGGERLLKPEEAPDAAATQRYGAA